MVIEIKFVPNTTGKFDFSAVQGDTVLYKKEYTASEKDETTGHTQAQVFRAYCQFLQDKIDKLLEKDPTFRWKSFQDFKKFAGAKTQNEFFENELKYLKYKGEIQMEYLLSKHEIYRYQVDIRTFNGVKTTLQWHPEDKSPKGMPSLFDHIRLGCINEEDNWVTQEYGVTGYEWNDYYGAVYYLQKMGED